MYQCSFYAKPELPGADCVMFRMGEGFCFSASHLISILVPGRTRFKKVNLILDRFSWRKGRCVASRSNAHRQSKQTPDSLQLWMRWGLQSRVNGRHMLLSSLTLTLFLCVCVTEAEERNVKSVFLVCTLKEKVSVCYIHREVGNLSDSKWSFRSHTGSL